MKTEWITPKEAAALAGCSTQTIIRRLAAHGSGIDRHYSSDCRYEVDKATIHGAISRGVFAKGWEQKDVRTSDDYENAGSQSPGLKDTEHGRNLTEQGELFHDPPLFSLKAGTIRKAAKINEYYGTNIMTLIIDRAIDSEYNRIAAAKWADGVMNPKETKVSAAWVKVAEDGEESGR